MENRPKLGELIRRIEEILGKELSELDSTLEDVSPEKRVDFVSKTLPLIVKYREENKDEWF